MTLLIETSTRREQHRDTRNGQFGRQPHHEAGFVESVDQARLDRVAQTGMDRETISWLSKQGTLDSTKPGVVTITLPGDVGRVTCRRFPGSRMYEIETKMNHLGQTITSCFPTVAPWGTIGMADEVCDAAQWLSRTCMKA